MVFGKLVLGGTEQYHRIDHSKVQTATFSDGEDPHGDVDEGELLLSKQDDEFNEEQCTHQQCINLVSKRRPLAPKKKSLPQQPESRMKLHIRKMDDATFAVEVSMKSTVYDLKNAVEGKFATDDSRLQISWPHVWGNFCLSFNNQKLLNDDVQLQELGIRDCAELYFVRHLTMSSGHRQRRSFFCLRKKQGQTIQRGRKVN